MRQFHLSPRQLIRGIIGVNVVMFLASLVFSTQPPGLTLNPFEALSPATNTLIFLGATGTIPMGHYQLWWSPATAGWLHGSLLHILFNMTALVQIAPLVTTTFGVHRMFIIYTVSSIAGFYLSFLAGVPVTIGASAAICGLIGATLYYGKARGGNFGQALFKQTMGWVVSLAVIGVLVPNINNWGHGGGLVAGAAAAWGMGYQEKSRESRWHLVVSLLFMGITLFLLFRSLLWAIYLNL